jgi:hypothetical protein
MTEGGFPDDIRSIVDAHASSRQGEAMAAYVLWPSGSALRLTLINKSL